VKKLLILILIFILLPAGVKAQYEELDSISENFSFSEATENMLSGKEILTPKTLWQTIKEEFIKETKNAVLSLFSVMGAVFLFSVLNSLGQSFSGGAEKVAFLVLYSATAAVLLKNFSETAKIATDLIDNLVLFLNAAVPVIGTSVISCGNFGVYSAMYPVLITTASLSANIIKGIGVPAIMMSLSIGVVGNISDTFNLSEISKTIRGCALWMICGLLTIFSAAVGICGMGAGGVNTVMMRGAKFVARSAIPVLGGLLSDSLDAVISGAVMLKNALGTAAVAGAVIIMIYPIIKVGAVIFVYKFAAAIITPFCDRRISNVIGEISGVLSCLIGFAAAEGALAIISVTALLSASNMGVMLK